MSLTATHSRRSAVEIDLERLLNELARAERAAENLAATVPSSDYFDLPAYVASVVSSTMLLARTLERLLPFDAAGYSPGKPRLTHEAALNELDASLTAARHPVSALVHTHALGALDPVAVQTWNMVDVAHKAVSVYRGIVTA